MDPHLKDVTIFLHDADREMVSHFSQSNLKMLSWKAVFHDYSDVWGGLTEEQVEVTRKQFIIGLDAGTVIDLFVFPSTSLALPGTQTSFCITEKRVSEVGQDLLYLQQFAEEITVRSTQQRIQNFRGFKRK